MKLTTSILLLVFCTTTFSQINEVEFDSKINAVTVFKNAAQIKREADIKLKTGYNRIKFKDLSPFINANTIQVKGYEGVTIVSVNHTLDYLADMDSNPLFETLLEERNDLIYEREKLRIEQNNLKRERNMIFINKNIKY